MEQQRFKYQFIKREMLPNLYEYITTWGAVVMYCIVLYCIVLYYEALY